MRRLLFPAAGMLAVGLTLVGTALAHGPGPIRPPSGRVIAVEAGKSAELQIVHIVKGCHSWTNGVRLAERAVVTMRPGGRLTILNHDVDLHKVVQLAGPRIATGARMNMNAVVRLRFAGRGAYRFKTVTSEMPGMMDMKTIGPDYQLVLVVRVT